MNMNSLKKAASGAIGKAKSVIKSTVNKGKAIVKKAEKKLASAIKGSTANTKKCINVKKSAENAAQKAIQIGKNVALNMAVKTGKTKSNAGKSASKRAEDAVKKVNSIVASAVRGSMVTATKTLAKSSGNSKLRNAVIGATGTTMCSDAIISKGKKQTNGEINVANLPVYNRAGNYIEGQKVKVKGVDGKWYVGTVKEDGYIGTGGARQFKFIPDNSAAYSKGNSIENCRSYKYAQEWKDFAKGVWNGMGERSEKMLNSPNDFMNYLTMGVWNSNAENGKKMLKTKNAYDIINWATMGGADMVNGAVNPEKPLSPEHWMNSFGVVSTVFGAKGMQNKYTHNDIIDIKKPYKKAVNDNKIEGGSKTKDVSNFKYKEGYYVEHTTGPVKKFTERNGISGGHNYDEFEKYFNDTSNKYQLDEIGRKNHPDIDGIFDIEYKVKYEKMDYTGKNGTGQYKIIPNGKPYKKTVYDPKIISNDEIIDLSKKAMDEGQKNNRIIQLTKQKKIKIQGQADYNGKTLKFEGIKNLETGEIENAYPVLEWE